MDELLIKKMSKKASDYFGLNEDELYGYKRNGNYDVARHIVWHYLHYELGMSTSKIAKCFNRDRRNIFHGIANIREGMKFQEYYSDMYSAFVEFVNDGK